MPIISKKDLERTKNKMGIYSKLRQPNQKAISLIVIEKTFRDFCKTHKRWTQEMEDVTWQNYYEILRKYL